MHRMFVAVALFAIATPVYAQSVVCDPTCRDPRTSSAASSQSASNSAARSSSRSNATGAIAGTQVNAPISSSSTSRGGSATSRSQGGSSNVVVVNRVSSGGGSRGYAGAGTTASDPPAATDPPGPVLGSPGDPLTENIGGTQTIRNVPEIVAPNISGGNPCLIGASGGVAVAGVGVTLGGGWSDKGCERRNEAALLSNMGEKDVAAELMCDDDHVRAAMARTGHPCAADRRVAAVAPQVVAGPIDAAVIRKEQAAAQPWLATPAQPVQVAATVATPVRPVNNVAGAVRPAWCETSSAAELRSHRECDVH